MPRPPHTTSKSIYHPPPHPAPPTEPRLAPPTPHPPPITHPPPPPPPLSSPSKTQNYHIFLIPGNPGCISYYNDFLGMLALQLQDGVQKEEVVGQEEGNAEGKETHHHHVFGHSLGNFYSYSPLSSPSSSSSSLSQNDIKNDTKSDNENQTANLLNLNEQIEFIEAKVLEYGFGFGSGTGFEGSAEQEVEERLEEREEEVEGEEEDREEDQVQRVVLIGHSVGAYIGMEILRRWREGDKNREREKALERERGRERAGNSKGEGEGLEENANEDKDKDKEGIEESSRSRMRIVGFIGLFPTVTHLEKSPRGAQIGWLCRLPFFNILIGILAICVRTLSRCLPSGVLRSAVKVVAGLPDDAAATTVEFLRSQLGLRQALYMARDEMNQITEDRWDEDIWGVATPSNCLEEDGTSIETANVSANPKLVFYFGQDDHWVADHLRDELIAARGYKEETEEKWKPKMEIAETGIPHDFCIRHNKSVARKVRGFLSDIIEADQDHA